MLTLGFVRLFRGPQSRLEHIVILIIGMPKRDNSFPAQVWGSSYSCGDIGPGLRCGSCREDAVGRRLRPQSSRVI